MILGSAAGSVLLMWLPSLWAFLFSFSITAHVLALISLLLLTVGAVFLKRPKLLPNDFPGKHKAFCRAERTLLLPLGLWLLFVFLVLHSFRYQNGEIWSSQCTYGDMSMHLGFITSIAEQKTFPPMYSILPGVKLSYTALSSGTSLLPNIAIEAPSKCIGSNTVDSMKSGAVYGTAALVDGMVDRMEAELGEPVTVVATGGLAGVVVPYCRRKIEYEPALLLKGLAILYEKNAKRRQH